MKNFVIYIGNSKAVNSDLAVLLMGEIVQRFLFRKGYKWGHHGFNVLNIGKNFYLSSKDKFTLEYGYCIDDFRKSNSELNNILYFNADTELGKFIEYIEKEEVPPQPCDIAMDFGATSVKLFTNGDVQYAAGLLAKLSNYDFEFLSKERKKLLDQVAEWKEKYGKKD